MDHLFGKLRSTLHSHAPSPRVWRALTQTLYPDHVARRAHEIVPYLDDSLDLRWPDHLRVAPQRWLRMAQASGAPHFALPIARTLRAFAPAADHPILFNGHLAAITHIFAEGARGDLAPLLLAPALQHLTAFHGAHTGSSPNALHALLSRHPSLTHLTPGYTAALPKPPALNLPNLRALNLRSCHAETTRHFLRDPDALPSLRDLHVHTDAPLPHDLLAPLTSLYIGPRSADALDTLPAASRLDHLHVCCAYHAAFAPLFAHPDAPSPRTLTLELGGHHQHSATLTPGSLLRRVQDLTLWRIHRAEMLRPAIQATRHQLLHLHLHSCELRGDDTLALSTLLTQEPWPHLESLRIERTPFRMLGADPERLARAFPNLRHLTIRAGGTLSDADLLAIFQAPWFQQLETLDINSAYYSAYQLDQHPIVSAVQGHPTLRHLGLCNTSLRPQHIDQLGDTALPALKILRLGHISDLKLSSIDHLANAPWLHQLQRLRLIGRAAQSPRGWSYKPDPLQFLNLHSRLIRSGLPKQAVVQY